MIQRALSLTRRLERETVRHAGSQARLMFFKGVMPLNCTEAADGEKLDSLAATEGVIRAMFHGDEPALVQDATYWRLLSNEGAVVMQGDGHGS